MNLLRFLAFLLGFGTPLLSSASPGPGPSRNCVIHAAGDGSDDSPAIRQAFFECGKNGHITFQEGVVYNVQTTLELTNLSNVQVDLLGTILFSTDVRYWIQNGWYYEFQNISIAMGFSGDNITIDGHGVGTIDGQGQVWYDCTGCSLQISDGNI
jgi:hypothetical protein